MPLIYWTNWVVCLVECPTCWSWLVASAASKFSLPAIFPVNCRFDLEAPSGSCSTCLGKNPSQVALVLPGTKIDWRDRDFAAWPLHFQVPRQTLASWFYPILMIIAWIHHSIEGCQILFGFSHSSSCISWTLLKESPSPTILGLWNTVHSGRAGGCLMLSCYLKFSGWMSWCPRGPILGYHYNTFREITYMSISCFSISCSHFPGWSCCKFYRHGLLFHG